MLQIIGPAILVRNITIQKNFMNWLDLINVIANTLIGIIAIVSLWISVRALKKSEWDSAMTTSPSLILRPKRIWVGVRNKEECYHYEIVEHKKIIKADTIPFEIVFSIEFECFNAGRGVAFNISQPISSGMPISSFGRNKIPLYQTLEDEPFSIELLLSKKFNEWVDIAEQELPVNLEIIYTNDQKNIYCKSTWKANVRPFKLDNINLKVRETMLLNRRGKIEYLDHPHTK